MYHFFLAEFYATSALISNISKREELEGYGINAIWKNLRIPTFKIFSEKHANKIVLSLAIFFPVLSLVGFLIGLENLQLPCECKTSLGFKQYIYILLILLVHLTLAFLITWIPLKKFLESIYPSN